LTQLLKHIAFLLLVSLSFHFQAKASHVMGGSITYECLGNGNYVFQLVFYRDCNGADINTNSQTIKVWNHPTLSSINLPFVTRENISPQGQQVGNISCYDCDNNVGIGSIERIIYRSNPINLSGKPPTQGWVFTFDDFSRNGNITNLQNPLNYGITLTAKIFDVNATVNVCHDSSPIFLQNTHFISCAGKPFKMNLNPVDPDLDSLAIEFDTPLNNLNNNPYVEGTNPTSIPFVNGFSAMSPTPNSAMNSGNIDASIDPISGEITFLSTMTGNFNLKFKIVTYRNKKRISEVTHEMQLVVTNCSSSNNTPIITPPFGGSFETNVNAGDIVNFSIVATDTDLLQDGTPQSVSIDATGLLFGPNPTVNTGCISGPCPTVSPNAHVTGVNGATINFQWQTDCSHLIDANGNELDMVPYQFVFRVQDNFCPIPEVVYETVTINVVNQGVIHAPEIKCIKGSGLGDFTLYWDPVTDSNGSFISYEIHTVQNGLIATLPSITTNSYTHTGVTSELDYFIAVVAGCSGQARRYSDTISNIYLNISNLNPGTAALDWNAPHQPAHATMGAYYYIYREYPTGTWSLIDSVPYNVTNYNNIIDICDEFLNYRITLNNTLCEYTSQINGATFTDQTPPDIPNVINVTIDTLTHETTINWTASNAPDTYGYIVYMQDPITGFLIEIDTVYGQFNNTYTYYETYVNGSVTYTVAAFDSCPSPTGAPFNLSARDPNFHTTIFLESEIAVCDSDVQLSWNPYGGWNALSYEIYMKINGGTWQMVGTTATTNYTFEGHDLVTYEIVIKAIGQNNITSFSNIDSFTVVRTAKPSYNYLQTASVEFDDSAVEIKHIYDQSATISRMELQRLNNGIFETIQTVSTASSPQTFIDEDVSVDIQSYTYRVVLYDSCGNEGSISNIGKTILLNTQIDNTELIAYLTWSNYDDFDGSIIGYYIYRSIDNQYNPTPIGFLSPFERSYQDDLSELETNSKVCYRVEAVEGPNVYASPQTSSSNESCVVIEPTIYVPNAFYPDGVNSVFIPTLLNYEIGSYRMTIFNRWGQVVFQSSNPLEGWNGRINNVGAQAETATYVYMIEIKDGNGEQIMTRGHVSLLR